MWYIDIPKVLVFLVSLFFLNIANMVIEQFFLNLFLREKSSCWKVTTRDVVVW